MLAVDRDNHIILLSTQKSWKQPPGWWAIKYSKLYSNVSDAETTPLPRRLVKATIGGQTYALHLDLGATTSQLRPRSWPKAKLAASSSRSGWSTKRA